MNSTLKGRSIASAIIGLVVLAVVAAMALVMNSAGGPVSFVNTAQEETQEDTQDDPAQDAGDSESDAQPPGRQAEGRGEGGGRPCRGGGGPFSHAIHGELIVPQRPAEGEERPEPGTVPTEFETIVVDNGTVMAVSDTSLTLERLDGESVTVELTEDTKQREDEDIAVGDKVHVVSDPDGVARAVMTRPDRPADAAEGGGGGAQGDGAPSGRPGPCPHRGPDGPPPAGREENSVGDVSTPQ